MPSLSGSDDTNSVAAPTVSSLDAFRSLSPLISFGDVLSFLIFVLWTVSTRTISLSVELSLEESQLHSCFQDLQIRSEVSRPFLRMILYFASDLPRSRLSSGQAFTIKLRPTKANTPDSLVIEMPWDVRLPSGERKPKGEKPRWRRMKMACGEVRIRLSSSTCLRANTRRSNPVEHQTRSQPSANGQFLELPLCIRFCSSAQAQTRRFLPQSSRCAFEGTSSEGGRGRVSG